MGVCRAGVRIHGRPHVRKFPRMNFVLTVHKKNLEPPLFCHNQEICVFVSACWVWWGLLTREGRVSLSGRGDISVVSKLWTKEEEEKVRTKARHPKTAILDRTWLRFYGARNTIHMDVLFVGGFIGIRWCGSLSVDNNYEGFIATEVNLTNLLWVLQPELCSCHC